MKAHGRTSVHGFLGDLIVYRNLVPLDPRLPPLSDFGPAVGLPRGVVPRKSEPAYAQAIVHLLRQARALEAPGAVLRRLIYVGDTRLNDGTAFANICHAGRWPGYAFIAAERDEPPRVEISESLYLSNRWGALADFDRFCLERGFALDEEAAVIVDLDKTALGARGRNDRVIDRARVEAVRRTVGDLLGDRFDAAGFRTAYDCLNQPEFHPFTTDNQDYLAYTCLILGSGLVALDPLVSDIRAGRLVSLGQFISQVDGRASELPSDLREIHESVMAYVRQGDPTPFKAFRHNEYRATVERMGWLPDGAPVSQMLEEELLVTQEVRAVALDWRARGALLFGLSDKPDEASLPDDELAAQGYRPIHQMATHAVGG